MYNTFMYILIIMFELISNNFKLESYVWFFFV